MKKVLCSVLCAGIILSSAVLPVCGEDELPETFYLPSMPSGQTVTVDGNYDEAFSEGYATDLNIPVEADTENNDEITGSDDDMFSGQVSLLYDGSYLYASFLVADAELCVTPDKSSPENSDSVFLYIASCADKPTLDDITAYRVDVEGSRYRSVFENGVEITSEIAKSDTALSSAVSETDYSSAPENERFSKIVSQFGDTSEETTQAYRVEMRVPLKMVQGDVLYIGAGVSSISSNKPVAATKEGLSLEKSIEPAGAVKFTAIGELKNVPLIKDYAEALSIFKGSDSQNVVEKIKNFSKESVVDSPELTCYGDNIDCALNSISDDIYFGLISRYTMLLGGTSDGASLAGDADGNGTVQAADALLALQISVGKVELSDDETGREIFIMDVDLSGDISVSDALLILQRAVGKISGFPVEAGIAYVPFVVSQFFNCTRTTGVVSYADYPGVKNYITDVSDESANIEVVISILSGDGYNAEQKTVIKDGKMYTYDLTRKLYTVADYVRPDNKEINAYISAHLDKYEVGVEMNGSDPCRYEITPVNGSFFPGMDFEDGFITQKYTLKSDGSVTFSSVITDLDGNILSSVTYDNYTVGVTAADGDFSIPDGFRLVASLE